MLSERPTMEEMEAFFNGDQFVTKAAGCRIVEGWKGHGVAEMELANIHKNAQGNIMGGAIATADLEKAGRHLSFYTVTVTDDTDRLIAKMDITGYQH